MEGLLRGAVRAFFRENFPQLTLYGLQLAEVPSPVFPAIFFVINGYRQVRKVFSCYLRCWLMTDRNIETIEELQLRMSELELRAFKFSTGGLTVVFVFQQPFEVERVDMNGYRGWTFNYPLRGYVIG